MPLSLDLWAAPAKKVGTVPATFEHELERWTALLDEPRGFMGDLFKYGELTVEGYFQARRSRELSRHSNWPHDAVAVAQLLVKCGAERIDAGYAAVEQGKTNSNENAMGGAKIVALHLALLKELNIAPSVETLMELMEYLDWRDSYFEDFINGFDVMLEYLPTGEDEEKFLDAYLPQLKPSRNAMGDTQSLGMALAATFHRAQPFSIIEWCKNNDDQVGLGYLVHQNRYHFAAWLFEVASPTCSIPLRRTFHPDPKGDIVNRKEEQLETLMLLADKLPEERLKVEGGIFYQTYPEMVEDLMKRTDDNPLEDNQIRWAFGLYKANVIPADHPSLQNWLDQAYAIQESFTTNNTLNKRSAYVVDNMHLLSMHYICGPVSVILGDKARTLLARDIVMRCEIDDIGKYLYNMPNKDWLRDISVLPMIHARGQADRDSPEKLLMSFFPFMPVAEKIETARILIDLVYKSYLKAETIPMYLAMVDQENYRNAQSFSKDLHLAISALTLKSPDSLFTSLESLEVKKNDALYLDMIHQWVAKQLQEQTPSITVPENIGDDVMGVLGY